MTNGEAYERLKVSCYYYPLVMRVDEGVDLGNGVGG